MIKLSMERRDAHKRKIIPSHSVVKGKKANISSSINKNCDGKKHREEEKKSHTNEQGIVHIKRTHSHIMLTTEPGKSWKQKTPDCWSCWVLLSCH